MEQSALEKLTISILTKRTYRIPGHGRSSDGRRCSTGSVFKAFSNLDALRDLNKFGSWVNVIASNYAIDMLRKKKK